MKKYWCVIVLVLVGPASWAAAEVTDVIDSFEDPFVNGPVGTQPPGWTYFGYGPPAWSTAETGLTTDGAQSYAWRLPLDNIAQSCMPGICDGNHQLYRAGVTINSLARRPIDWSQPVTVSVDIHCADVSVNGKWRTGLFMPLFADRDDSHSEIADWGDNGVPNSTWQTVYVVLGPGSQTSTGYLILFVDFAVHTGDVGENTAIFDNLRITYTPIPSPEVCNNDIDDDLDGLTDCEDTDDCTGDPACPCNLIVIFDTDFDGDVDQADFGFLQACLTGPGDPGGVFDFLPAACQCLDVAGGGGSPDRALDQQDILAFEVCASGPAILADPACDGGD